MTDKSFDELIEDLQATGDAEFASAPTKAGEAKQKFPCQQCAGTGLYRGRRVHQDKAHCFACKGKGYFLTDARTRAKSREKAQARKIDARDAGLTALEEAQPGLLAFLRKAGEWSEFAASLAQQAQKTGSLSERQIQAGQSMRAKMVAREESRAAARKAASAAVDLSPIKNMFDAAVRAGFKRPAYRAEGLTLTRAPDTGRNPGALYIRNEADVYGGKVLGVNFTPSREGADPAYADGKPAAAALAIIAQDPLAAAIRYGHRTGRCACCGRTLTNDVSIQRGIGPICAERWQLNGYDNPSAAEARTDLNETARQTLG